MTAGRLLDGTALAGALRRKVASRLSRRRVRDPAFPVPTLGLVAADVHAHTRRFVTLKERAFREAGLSVRPRILPARTDTAEVLEALEALASDPDVHGIFLQYPLPPGVDARRCFDAIPPARDVDGSSGEARRLLGEGREIFAPATPRAVVRLLESAVVVRSGAGLPGPSATAVTLVSGDAGVAGPLATLLRRRRLEVRTVDADDPALEGEMRRAPVLVTCAGRAGAVDGRWVADGAVVVDAGYHHPDGRGDFDPEPELRRLAAYAPARGGVGPLTVAILAAHTLEAAEAQVFEAS